MNAERREEYINIDAKISEIHRRIDDYLETERGDAIQLAALRKDLDALQVSVVEIRETLQDILDLMEQSKGVLKFIKVLSVVAVSGAALWSWMAGHVTFTAGK